MRAAQAFRSAALRPQPSARGVRTQCAMSTGTAAAVVRCFFCVGIFVRYYTPRCYFVSR
jgi:hypothetical protein